MNDVSKRLMESLQTSFIDHSLYSDKSYRPQLVKNDYKNHEKVLTSLLDELNTCLEFYFSVAFITSSGIATLLNTFNELKKYNIKGKILTTNYLTFTDPKALEKLLLFPNIEVRAYVGGNFHPKGYIFKQTNYWSVIIGSSNLTQDALSKNMEWNLKIISCVDGELVRITRNEFDKVWNDAVIVNSEWIQGYSQLYNEQKLARNRNAQILPELLIDEKEIVPNTMQKEAMVSLKNIRENKGQKALIISATGTGKTYLAAFDVQQYQAKRFLFLVHRETVLRKTEGSFKEILGKSISTGFVIGKDKEIDKKFVFGMIQTISREDTLKSIPPDTFDYIVIDEAHRSGAESYKKIIDYFKPEFLLGLTATPERTDDFDIYSLFDHTIAYEIRLQKALELDMLCPFHYYGVSEIKVNGEELDEKASFRDLVSTERINHIVDKIEFYKNNSEKTKGLIFCSRNEESFELSVQLNKKGYTTVALSGSNTEEERESTIRRLEEGIIDYIVSVDIFNEGIDIPAVNQVVMLRPTQSAIIFVQQLGRGLRKVHNKEYLTVIDFIGNYANNFMIPIALFGDTSYNHDALRKLINSGSSSIPGASTINFDLISREKIFNAINNASFNQLKLLREEYNKVKYRLGRIPTLVEFQENESIDPIVFLTKYESYPQFLLKVEKYFKTDLLPLHLKSLRFFSNEIAPALRAHELVMIQFLLDKGRFTQLQFNEHMKATWYESPNAASFNSALRILENSFFIQGDRNKFGNISYLKFEEKTNTYHISEKFFDLLKSDQYKNHLKQVIDLGFSKHKKLLSSGISANGFVMYEKYSRKDACKLLNWESDEASTIYGYKIQYKTKPLTCPIFVTYNKSDEIDDSIKYEDVFIDNETFSWMTRNGVRIDSKEPTTIMAQKENNIRIQLFVKKSDGEGRDFYYVGEMEPLKAEQQTMISEGKTLPVVNILFRLKTPVRQDIFSYFENIRT